MSPSAPSVHTPESLRELRTLASRLDPGAYAFGDAGARLRDEVAVPLRALIDDAIDVLDALEKKYGSPAREQPLSQFDWDAAFEMTPLITDDMSLPHPIELNLSQSAADLCYTARSELKRVKRHLDAPQRSHEDLLLACERGRRKLRRCAAVVIEATSRLAGDEPEPELDHVSELEAAVAIRKMYAKFRRSLLPCRVEDPDSVRRAIRYAAVSLAVMIGSTDFADVRLSDRLMLSDLQARIIRWAKDPRPADGARLFRDVEAASELLRAINLREELQAHDRALLRDASKELSVCTDDGLGGLLGRLRALHGLDDELDAVLRQAMAHAPLPGIRRDLTSVVERLAREEPTSAPPGW